MESQNQPELKQLAISLKPRVFIKRYYNSYSVFKYAWEIIYIVKETFKGQVPVIGIKKYCVHQINYRAH